jgi:hypothetical protein
MSGKLEDAQVLALLALLVVLYWYKTTNTAKNTTFDMSVKLKEAQDIKKKLLTIIMLGLLALLVQKYRY